MSLVHECGFGQHRYRLCYKHSQGSGESRTTTCRSVAARGRQHGGDVRGPGLRVVESLLERPLADWLAGLPAAAAVNTPRAFLGYAIECLLDLRDGTGWDSEYQRDVWLLRRLGVAGHDGARLDFTAVQPLWLRELAKRWCRWRMSCGVGLGQLRKDRIALVRLSRLTPGLASSTDPSALDRAALEGYLARLAVELPHPKTRSTDIGAVTGFLHAVRQHRWASLPAEAQLYPSDHPRRDETPAPRAIPEFVMHQLEGPANLDRITDPRIRLLVEILIRTGLRIGDATRLALDCLVRDPQGAVYLRYRNHKMRRDAVVPIDDELTTMIEAQQARARQRFPTTAVLLPRGSANPDGRLPIPTATFHLPARAVARNLRCHRRTRSAGRRSPPISSGTRSHPADQP